MSSVSGDLKPWWYNDANTLASSPWADITREDFVILHWELHPTSLPSFYPTNFLGPPPTVTGGGWKAREWGDTLSTLSLSLSAYLSQLHVSPLMHVGSSVGTGDWGYKMNPNKEHYIINKVCAWHTLVKAATGSVQSHSHLAADMSCSLTLCFHSLNAEPPYASRYACHK